MPAFRKIPVQVEALQWTGSNIDELSEFTNAQFSTLPQEERAVPEITAEVYDKLHVTWIGVKTGDWIIRGIEGEFYPCDEKVFAATYAHLGPHPRRLTWVEFGQIEKILKESIASYREHLDPDAIAHVQADFAQALDYWADGELREEAPCPSE
jgi:hypothetical protein